MCKMEEAYKISRKSIEDLIQQYIFVHIRIQVENPLIPESGFPLYQVM